ncbi:MAG: sulfur carrier protein ThiS [bacterium]|nr:sulfur carrier protein ThiS [bacterium]
MTDGAANFAQTPAPQLGRGYAGSVNVGHHIHVNGDPRNVPRECTLEALLATLELGESRVAVAINRDIVPRTRYAKVLLADGDRIEILEAVGGG